MDCNLFSKVKEAKRNNDLLAMKKLYEENSNDPRVKCDYADLLRKNGKTGEAKILLFELLRSGREVVCANYILGKITLDEGNIEEAKKYFKKVLKYKPHDVICIYELGRIESRAGNDAEAKKYFEEALAIKPSDTYTRLELAKLEIRNGNIKQARKHLNYSLSVKRDKQTLFEFAKLESKEGNLEEALKYIDEIIEKDPKDVYALLELGKIESRLGNDTEARRIYNYILKIKPNDAATMVEMGILEEKEGNIEQAKEWYSKPISMRLRDDFAYRPLVNLEYRAKNYTRVSELLKEAMSRKAYIDPNILAMMFDLGVFFKEYDYSKMDRYYTAMQIYDYDEYAAIESIIARSKDSEIASFKENVDVCKLFVDIKGRLTKENLGFSPWLLDDYYILFDEEMGSNGEKIVKVEALPGTKDIVSMYPITTTYYKKEPTPSIKKKV